ncbi:MAG TPA: ribosome small subunit-dependent GTPase A [Steroidobacteraceae bacterium]|nr:ribosome small subunit-dependent GTPase A [Steroidobacteraceae bacterium]
MKAGPGDGDLREGRVVASHGRDAVVADAAGLRVHCRLHGRRLSVVCGDRVHWSAASTEGGGGVIRELLPRRNCLSRIDARGTPEAVASNLSQLVAVLAPVPAPDLGLCDRYLAAAEWNGLAACVVANKCDLADGDGSLDAALEDYARIGYSVVRASKRLAGGADALRQKLAGTTSVLVGQSGVGKSSLTNVLVPGVEAAVADVSRASETGRHTTSTSSLYSLPSGGELIDSPGVRDFAPPLPPVRDVAGGFREIAGLAGSCRFRDCLHRAEPGCAVAAARDAGDIAPRRFESYRSLLALAEEMAARAPPRVRR